MQQLISYRPRIKRTATPRIQWNLLTSLSHWSWWQVKHPVIIMTIIRMYNTWLYNRRYDKTKTRNHCCKHVTRFRVKFVEGRLRTCLLSCSCLKHTNHTGIRHVSCTKLNNTTLHGTRSPNKSTNSGCMAGYTVLTCDSDFRFSAEVIPLDSCWFPSPL